MGDLERGRGKWPALPDWVGFSPTGLLLNTLARKNGVG